MQTVNTDSGSALGRFQELLRGLFRFGSEDLDFGIYRILKAKRSEVEEFISSALPEIAEGALIGFASSARESLDKDLAELRREIRAAFGDAALDGSDVLSAEFSGTPLAEKLVSLKSEIEKSSVADSTRASIFNDLHRFFERYYVDGDFMPRRRYGRADAYVVPYHGENVLLHWANRDQYYVKSDDVFRAYTFGVGNGEIILHLDPVADAADDEPEAAAADADEPTATASKAHFTIPRHAEVAWDDQTKSLRIPFDWRTITTSEARQYKGRTQSKIQAEINEAAIEPLLGAIVEIPDAAGQLGGAEALTRSLTEHLRTFTSRNSADFFIHRDLKAFLDRELDVFLTHEVLNLADVIARGEGGELDIRRASVVREIGKAIIVFLAQIEDVQRALFEKPKLVVSSHYCVTIDRLSDDNLKTAIGSDAQRTEWEELYRVTVGAETDPATLRDEHPNLVVDTRHFDEGFKWEVLAEFNDVDAALDGVLVKSESYHALRLLAPTFEGAVQSAYVDPPFNTENSQFLYRDSYRDSCWLSLMANRLEAARALLKDDAAFFLHLDENSNYLARFLMDSVFGRGSFRDEIIWRIGWASGYKTQAPSFVRNHETIFLYGARGKPYFAKDRMAIPYVDIALDRVKDEVDGIIAAFGLDDPTFARQRLVFSSPDGTIYKVGSEDKEGRYWIEDTWNSNEYEQLDSNKIKRNVAEYTPHGSLLTQKPEQLLQRIITSTTNEGDVVLDYMAGSGTTAAVAKKLNRRFIAVETGQYFESDILWRMKQVLWGRQVGISRQVGHEGGGFFKYMQLETFEDAIENLKFDSTIGELGRGLFGTDYLVRYAFNAEAKMGPFLSDGLPDPFDVHMELSGTGGTTARVDVPGTFSAWTGLRAIRYRQMDNNGITYRGVLGDRDGKRWAVVWRHLPVTDEDALGSDRDFLDERVIPALADDLPIDRIFVNGVCVLQKAESADALLNQLAGG